MGHNWVYSDKENRKCEVCKMVELWLDDEDKWIWISTDEFMDSSVLCTSDLEL